MLPYLSSSEKEDLLSGSLQYRLRMGWGGGAEAQGGWLAHLEAQRG